MVIQLLAGMFIGSVVVCLVWGFILKSSKSKADALLREREEIMRSLGVLWVQIDSLIATHKNSKFGAKGVLDAFNSKIEEINRLFKPNIHKFDVYYVKYTENVIAHYNRAVLKGEMPVTVFVDSSADVELETNYSVVEQFAGSDAVASAAVSTKTAPVQNVKSTNAAIDVPSDSAAKAADDTFQINFKPEAEAAKPVIEMAEKTENVVVEKVEVPAAPDTDLFEVTTAAANASEEVKEVPLPAIDIPETRQESEATFDFEAIKAPGQEFTMDIAMAKTSELTVPAAKTPAPIDEDMAAFEQTVAMPESGASTKKEPAGDEDFTMETLVDVDISTISPFLKKDAAAKSAPSAKTEEHDLFEVSSAKDKPAEGAADLEIVIAANASHRESKGAAVPAAKAPDITAKTEVPTPPVKGPEPAAAAENEADLEAFFDKATQPTTAGVKATAPAGSIGVSQADLDRFDKDEETITGDDVASKIAALEFSGSLFPAKPPVAKAPDAKKENPVAAKPQPITKPVVPAVEKKSPASGLAAAAPKAKSHDDSITGDDVADKIDAFFGLFDDK